MTGPQPVPAEVRFWRRVVRRSDNECWEWSPPHNPKGYGQLAISQSPRRTVFAHRFSYELHKGPIPDGLVIDHLCRNRACVNPAHLEAVTNTENLRRSPLTIAGRNMRKTHCPQGHPYDEVNTLLSRDGRRYCQICHRKYRRETAQRKRAAARKGTL